MLFALHQSKNVSELANSGGLLMEQTNRNLRSIFPCVG